MVMFIYKLEQILFIFKSLDRLTTRKTSQSKVLIHLTLIMTALPDKLVWAEDTLHSFIHTLHTQYTYTFLSKHRKRPGFVPLYSHFTW